MLQTDVVSPSHPPIGAHFIIKMLVSRGMPPKIGGGDSPIGCSRVGFVDTLGVYNGVEGGCLHTRGRVFMLRKKKKSWRVKLA
mmetsp:Transcript_39738/g.104979  ORF Transcript_39738/g.104979 Transcript_39738/m.104979 type:complete len:83 (-) Transcript_39738:245-493(-)